MAQAALAAQVVSGVAGGLSAMSQGRAQKKAAEINAFIGETRATQTAASAADNLASEMATMRATLAANGQRPSVGTSGLFGELRRIRSREARIAVQNEKQGAADYRRQGANAMAQARAQAFSSFVSAVPSMFDLYSLNRGP